MAFLFEHLDVYTKSMHLADEITSLTESFPPAKYFLRDQLNRAVFSVPNNIAEGNGRFTPNDKIHFSTSPAVPRLNAWNFNKIKISKINQIKSVIITEIA
jgi:hypothetical protein